MILPRPSSDRGQSVADWLDSRHSFSFNQYDDPAWRGFRNLLVINEDVIAPGGGFPTHAHANMEILTWVFEGALEHKDSSGGGGIIRQNDLQRMSAGKGIRHSEFNHSKSQAVHLLQVWLLPARKGITPNYEQKTFTPAELQGKLRLLCSQDGREGSLQFNAKADVYAGRLKPSERVKHAFKPRRHGWVQVVRGVAVLNGITLNAGDGAALSKEKEADVFCREDAEFLLFDLA